MRSFHVRSKIVNGVAVLYLKGHLDAHQVARFEKEIVRMIKDRTFKILINGQDLNYITSAGMGIIMGYIDEVREKGGDIKLCSLNERVHETFDLVGFTKMYDFVASEQAAIEKFNRFPSQS
ncbi:MAG: STAS domain-containing protein [Candidatus Aminicenantes bacterium]|nr:STAS domain-containing protein [Candidatus Aminicenantes bacterium]